MVLSQSPASPPVILPLTEPRCSSAWHCGWGWGHRDGDGDRDGDAAADGDGGGAGAGAEMVKGDQKARE